jgi:drug/metabolite transporter (DMT)-like permease
LYTDSPAIIRHRKPDVSPVQHVHSAFQRVGSAVAVLPPNLIASGLMIAAFITFTMMAVMVRIVGPHIPIIEIVFIRQCMAMIFLSAYFWRARESIRAPRRIKLHIARGVTATVSMTCGLTATLLIPLADVTAIQMAEVLIVTALAALFLGERVGWRRWLATIVGFAGVLVMLRPFGNGVSLYANLALVGAFFGAVNMIVLRAGAKHDRIETVLFWQGIVVLCLVSPLAISVWVQPTLMQAGALLFMSIIFTLGLWLMTLALRMGETSALAPLHYLRLLMMGAVGWWVYGEVPTFSTVIGAGLVLTAATYTIRRNAERNPEKVQVDPSLG